MAVIFKVKYMKIGAVKMVQWIQALVATTLSLILKSTMGKKKTSFIKLSHDLYTVACTPQHVHTHVSMCLHTYFACG